MARPATQAERWRAHRAEMELVLATGCTPIAARAELRRREAERRGRCGRSAPAEAIDNAIDNGIDRLGEAAPRAIPGEMFGEWDAGWMMRD